MKVRNLTRAGVKRRYIKGSKRRIANQIETVMTDAIARWGTAMVPLREAFRQVTEGIANVIEKELRRRLVQKAVAAVDEELRRAILGDTTPAEPDPRLKEALHEVYESLK